MAKGTTLDESTKEAIRADVRNMGKSGETKKAIAARHGIHPTMISKIMNGKKAPKRKVKRAVKAKKNNQRTIDVVLRLYFKERNAFIEHRNAANELKKELDSMWKELD